MKDDCCTILIPARMESSRLPGKPLIKISNLPMIVHVAKRCALYKNASDVVVCTDSADIIYECEKYGIDVVNTTYHHKNGTTRIAEAASILGLDDDSIVIDVQGDEPLVDPEYIDQVHSFIRSSNLGCCVPFQKFEETHNKNRVKIVSSGERVIYFTRSDAPTYFSKPFAGYKKHLSVIGFRHQTLQAYAALPIGELEAMEQIELFRLIENGIAIGTFEMSGSSTSVDTPADLELVKRAILDDRIYQENRELFNA